MLDAVATCKHAQLACNQHGLCVSVPNYMPAEALLQGIPVKCRDDDEEVIIGSGPKVDIWSLGIILLEKILVPKVRL